MAYNVTGTAGNDTLNQAGDAGPGTIVGLAGNDFLLTGNGLTTVDGGAGADTVVLQAGNTGTVTGAAENDSISDGGSNIGSMHLWANEGADTINIASSTNPQSIVGGNDAADAGDSLRGGDGADIIFGNGGADTLDGRLGNDMFIGGFGNDSIFDPGAGDNDFVFGNEGNDTIDVYPGNDTIFAGQGDDSVIASEGSPLAFLNEGNDTFLAPASTSPVTVAGGNDSADGNDSIIGGFGADVLFGNGGADTLFANSGNNILIGGFGTDSIDAGFDADFIFGNESNDTIYSGSGGDTVFAGQGDDTVVADLGADSLNGNEGNDTIRGGFDIDTITGGSGADVFAYTSTPEATNAAGGTAEWITDANFAEDRFLLSFHVDFVTGTSAGAAATLLQAATNAIAAAWATNGSVGANVAAVFTFNGRTYLAGDDGFVGVFTNGDFLVDITGAIGTVNAASFLT